MKLENIVLSEINEMPKHNYCVTHLHEVIEVESGLEVTEGWRRGKRS